MSPASRVARCGGLLLVLVWSAAAVTAADSRGPGRIAVGGVMPTGYVGALARFGLPRDLLYDEQLTDAALLTSYDLVIIAGVPPVSGDLAGAVTKVLAKGGAVLLDLTSPGPALRGLLGDGDGRGLAALGLVARSRATVRLVGDGNPLAQAMGKGASFEPGQGGLVPASRPGDLVLAEYEATTPLADGDRDRKKDRKRGKADEGPKGPALVLRRQGAGRMLVCGPPIGQATGLMGQDHDKLIGAMVALLTDGRAVAQLEAEGGHLGRKQSARSLGKTARTSKPKPPVERPNGPGAAAALPTGYAMVEKEPADEFNLGARLGNDRSEVLCNYWSPNSYLRVELSRNGVRIARVTGATQRVLGASAQRLAAGSRIVLKERDDQLTVHVGQTAVTADIRGLHRGAVASKGDLGEVEYQAVDDVFFSDDFMRTNDSSGGWETVGGKWQTAPVQNPDMGANPFSYKAEAPDEIATAINGHPFWDEYRYTCAVRPGEPSGSVGLGFYAQDANNLYLFAVKVRQQEKLPDGFALLRVTDGQVRQLSVCPGGLLAGQWYQLQVRADGDTYTACVDGQPVLTAKDAVFTGGKVALRADHTKARFDDVLVETNDKEDDRGRSLQSKVPDYAGLMDLDSWAGPALQWEADPAQPGLFWRRNSFFGDLMLKFEPKSLPDGATLTLLAESDGTSTTSGYALSLQRRRNSAALELRHRGQVVSRGQAAIGDGVQLQLGKSTNGVLGLVNDRVVVTAPRGGKVEGGRVAFQATGFKPKLSTVSLWATNLSDYAFDTAPVDWWVASGSWDVTNRWSCTPDWSWFGGVGQQVAAIWHKQPMQGDTVMDFYAGAKMLEKDGRRSERTGDFNAALCGDGRDSDSGYAFLVHPRTGGAILRRQGKEVARNPKFRLFSRGHNRWANVRVERRGGQVQLYVDGQLVLDYDDPQPLTGGYAGIWTQDNGIMVARVTLSYEQAGKPWLSLR